MTCAKLAGMLEQAPATAVIHPLECVSARGRIYPIGRAWQGPGRLTPGAHGCVVVLAAAVLALAPGCSLLLDFDVPPIDAPASAAPADARPDTGPIDAAPDAGPIDAALLDAQDGGEPDASGVDATPPVLRDDR